MQIDQETLDVLGAGDFLSRVYTQSGEAQPIGLFIGYFPTQRTGVTIHSPKNCLPGSGWAFESSQYVNLNDANGKPHRVGEYIIANGENRQFVIYWYQAHGRSIANEYMAKVYLVTDAMRLNRTDGALVRVITPIDSERRHIGGKGSGRGIYCAACAHAPSLYPELSGLEGAGKGNALQQRISGCVRTNGSQQGWKTVKKLVQGSSSEFR